MNICIQGESVDFVLFFVSFFGREGERLWRERERETRQKKGKRRLNVCVCLPSRKERVRRIIYGGETKKERQRTTPTFPRAKSAPSKNNITPNNIKSPPNVVSATPISEINQNKNKTDQR